MPLVAIAMIPLLIGVAVIYPWTNPSVGGAFTGFKGAWLSTGFFVVRTIIYLVVLSLFAWGLLAAKPELRAPIAAVGVILYALIGSLIGIDFAGIDRAATSIRRSTDCWRSPTSGLPASPSRSCWACGAATARRRALPPACSSPPS